MRLVANTNKRWREWDLNPRPRAYESPALPAELPRHYESGKMVLRP